MAKRFIDTGFYKSPFVRGLKGSLKGLYTFIICDCDGSGIWNCDLEVASLYTGFSFTLSEFEKAFVDTGKAINLQNGKYFFPDFLEHQYPSGLSEKNPAHKNFILELTKYELLTEDLKVLERPFEGSKVKVMVKETVEVEEKGNGKSEKFDFKKELLKYGFQENLVDEWLKIRKTKKAVNTETALRGFLIELETRSCEPNLILKTIIERSWSGFKWSWIDNLEINVNGKTKTGNSNSGQTHVSPLRDAARKLLQGSESADDNGGS